MVPDKCIYGNPIEYRFFANMLMIGFNWHRIHVPIHLRRAIRLEIILRVKYSHDEFVRSAHLRLLMGLNI